MIKLGICQEDSMESKTKYPKIVVIDGDTLILITTENVDSINTTYITLDEYKQRDSVNNTIISMYEYREENFWKPILKEKDYQLAVKDTIIDNKDKIIDNQDTIIEEKDDKIKRLKIKKVASIGLAVLFLIIAI